MKLPWLMAMLRTMNANQCKKIQRGNEHGEIVEIFVESFVFCHRGYGKCTY